MKSILLIASILIGINLQAQSKRQFAIVDTSGTIVHQFEARWASAFYNNRARVKKAVVENNKAFYRYGFLNAQGQTVIPFIYEDAKEFKGKSTWVKESGSAVYVQIDLKGNRMNELEFHKIGSFSNGIWKVKKESGEVNYSGKPLYNDGYVTDTGELIIDPEEKYFGAAFSDGFVCVGQDNKGYGFLDKEGNVAIPFEKKQSGYTSFDRGLARRINPAGKIGIINKQNEWIAAPTNLSMSGFDPIDSVITIIYNTITRTDFGYTDFNYKPLFSKRYELGHSFKNGFAEVKEAGKWGVIDKKGSIVIPLKYDAVYNEADENYFMAYNEEGGRTTEWFYFDLDGNKISKVEAFMRRPHRYERFAVQAGKNEHYLYNEDGNKLHEVPFKTIQNSLEFEGSESTDFDFSHEGVAIVQLILDREYPKKD